MQHKGYERIVQNLMKSLDISPEENFVNLEQLIYDRLDLQWFFIICYGSPYS